MKRLRKISLGAALLVGFVLQRAPAELSENLLANPTFKEGKQQNGLPERWALYGGLDELRSIQLLQDEGDKHWHIRIDDNDPAKEIGLFQDTAAKGGETYQASALIRAVPGSVPSGIYIQLRFFPSNKFVQGGLGTRNSKAYKEVAIKATAPPGTNKARVYVYTHTTPTPKLIVREVRLVSGVPPPPPPPPPAPIPPVYEKLKNLHLETELVKAGRPDVTIVSPDRGSHKRIARKIQKTIKSLTGVVCPIESDVSQAAAVPIQRNLIAIGNRSTNRVIGELYHRYFTLLDLRYPGSEGHLVRTLHNPFGDGRNVVFVGGSDEAGLKSAGEVFIQNLKEAKSAGGGLTIGRLMEIKLGKGIEVPEDLREFETWEASRGYRSVGYFGWNSLSKRLAMYYMTGDEFQAREFIRLAFPDEQAKKEIADIDGERIENKDDPLAGPYHYNAHMMILFWDLVEESPVFTDEERLRVTNGFSRQFNHRKGERIYGLTQPSRMVGSRHGQWSAVSLYCLSRYFQKDYPNPIWKSGMEGAKMYFASLHEYSWVGGESDNLFWYNTGIAPIFSWLLLSGDRRPVENGILRKLILGQEILATGKVPDWALNSASLGFLHKAAYLLQDGRYIDFRKRTGVDVKKFRLGQSFWPEEHLKLEASTDLIGKWTIQELSEPAWIARNSGLAWEESFQFGSYRNTMDARGDYVLVDGFNGASRNPYHTFALLELRLDGTTLLKGYRNQVLTRSDGMVEPRIPMDAALKYRDVIGQTTILIAEVPNAPFCSWKRMFALRAGRYALIVDDLAFRTDSDNSEIQIKWETETRPIVDPNDKGVLLLESFASQSLSKGWRRIRALENTLSSNPKGSNDRIALRSYGIMLLRSREVGDWLEMAFHLEKSSEGEVFADLLNYKDRGFVRIDLDGKQVIERFEHYSPVVESQLVPLGRQRLKAGEHRLRITATGRQEGVDRCYVGLAGLGIRPKGAAAAEAPPKYEIHLSDPVETTVRGRTADMEWRGPVKKGEHRILFSLIGKRSGARENGLGCHRLEDNVAALALPEPAVAIAGRFRGVDGELVVIGVDHLFGRGLRKVDSDVHLISADSPVDVDWDFNTGQMHLVLSKETSIHISAERPERIRIDGKKHKAQTDSNGRLQLSVSAGRHVFENVKPGAEWLKQAKEHLPGGVAIAKSVRAKRVQALDAAGPPPVPELPLSFTLKTGRISDLIVFTAGKEVRIAAAQGKSVLLISPKGQILKKMTTDGEVRLVRWWKEHSLLLAGCADEKVVAFDMEGNRKWIFVSEMDPAVYRAAKTYWFKSAPGHAGIHGLDTGVFLDGKSQVFVGSACTLEIIDEYGQLIRRMPQFWGKVSLFRIIDGPDDSLNLLAARKYNGTNTVAIINNKKLDPTPRGFYTVPAGHTYVGGWTSMNRHHLFYEDIDGDGKKEVISEINGSWNRVTIWDASGKPLHDVSFGPGERIPFKNIRDIELTELNSDGKQEIVVALSSGLVVALDHKCRKLWSRRFPQTPEVLAGIQTKSGHPRIVVGCSDGSVLVLDGTGHPVQRAKVPAKPTHINSIQSASRKSILIATPKGLLNFLVE